jgi:hypothetical protein
MTATDPAIGRLVAAATGSGADGPVLVYVFQPTPESSASEAVVTRPDCQVVARFTL